MWGNKRTDLEEYMLGQIEYPKRYTDLCPTYQVLCDLEVHVRRLLAVRRKSRKIEY